MKEKLLKTLNFFCVLLVVCPFLQAQAIRMPEIVEASSHTAYHNSAWYGNLLSYTEIVPAEDSPVKAETGNIVERWNVDGGLYDLLANAASRGLVFSLKTVPAGKFVLHWLQQARPDGGESAYFVRITSSGTEIVSQNFVAPARTEQEGPAAGNLYFEIENPLEEMTVSFVPAGTGTKGALVGSFEIGVPAAVTGMNFVAAENSSPVFLTRDDGSAFPPDAAAVAYVSGENPAVVPVLDGGIVPDAMRVNFGGNVILKAENQNYYLVKRSGNQAIVPAGTVDCFDDFLLTWEACYGGIWTPAGETHNEIYFTFAAPATTLRQETLFWIACAGDVRGLNDWEEIWRAIWRKFSVGDNSPANLCNKAGRPLKYWGNWYETPLYFSAGELLANCEGRCGAWAELLVAAFRVHGFRACADIGVVPAAGNEALIVKNYKIENAANASANAAYPYVIDWMNRNFQNDYAGTAYAKFVDEVGVAGQNNANPPSFFENHALVVMQDFYLDPSYGIKRLSLKEWEEAAVWGFADLNQGFGNLDFDLRALCQSLNIAFEEQGESCRKYYASRLKKPGVSEVEEETFSAKRRSGALGKIINNAGPVRKRKFDYRVLDGGGPRLRRKWREQQDEYYKNKEKIRSRDPAPGK